ncbi:Protein of unknown function [Noviherbaspirillum humi]|uniref:DUF2868 domain-containing protein n=1 Tax=Noviherbaspirillum humi TaxID=1688639 RepID=A0A239KJP1_9BURK|nr:DUF2868 domain-containing protein [Noviherbaspirillum humi]SNT18371.1 Protein of unknown function [Noviherbaspirillum humi]
MPSPAHQSVHSSLSALLVARTVQLVEADGPLEDSAEMRQAFAAADTSEARLLERARLLGLRLGLDGELARWRGLAGLVLLALPLLVFSLAWSITAAVIGAERTINAVLAFILALGMHGLTLLAWLLALIFSRSSMNLFNRLSLGNLALRLVAWLPPARGPQSLTLLRAAHDLLRRGRLLPWAFGLVSHGVWALAFVLVLLALIAGFSFRAYRLGWETTILDPAFFAAFVRATGWLPHLIGFPLPDTATLLHPDAPGGDQRAWAWWLIGCVFVYGLVPRLLLAALCALVWRRGRRRLRLDTADPYYRKLLSRFEAMAPSEVVDREQRPEKAAMPARAAMPSAGGTALIGFELPEDAAWPPPGIAVDPALTQRIAGSSEERRTALAMLAAARPARLLLACHAPSTPDRGTERFLREAAAQAGACALLLPASVHDAGAAAQLQRWRDWLRQIDLPEIALFAGADEAAGWLGAAHA